MNMNMSNAVVEKFNAMREEGMQFALVAETRKSLFDLIKNGYHEILTMALDEYERRNMSEKNEAAGEIVEPVESDVPGCPHCGAHDQHSTDRQWLGVGEFEHCRICGADFQHCHPDYPLKKPIEEWEIADLLGELREVQEMYNAAPMTYEEAHRNRQYFQRLASALAGAKASIAVGKKPKRNLFNTREEIEKWEEEQRNFKLLYDYAIDLICKVSGGKVAKYFLEEGLPVNGIDELKQLVAELELENRAKAVLT